MQAGSHSLLTETLILTLVERGNLRSYARGEFLIHQGELSDALYILVSGQVEVFTRDERGRELVSNILKPGYFMRDLVRGGFRDRRMIITKYLPKHW